MANEQQILHVSPRMKALEIKMHLELKSHPAEKVPYVISRRSGRGAPSGASYEGDSQFKHPARLKGSRRCEGTWIPKFQEYGIETYLWMVNDTYLRNVAEELGFT